MILKIKDIHKEKKSDIAIILGCGSSINCIPQTDWKLFEKCDTFVMNFFLYHDFVPNFYYLELKQRYFKRWTEERLKKGSIYDDVNFIYPEGRIKYCVKAIGSCNKIFTYKQFQHWNSKRENISIPKNFRLHNQKLTKAFSGSLSLIVDLVFKMKYKYVVFYGIDLINSKYFWTDSDIKNVHTKTNKGYPEEHNHNTFGMQDYLHQFYCKFVKPTKAQKWYLGTDKKLSALSKYFKHVEIEKIIKK